MSNFINDDITIDFEVPKDIKRIIDICEEADRNDDYGLYMNFADLLTEVASKEAYKQGHLTKKQWEQIEMRYPQ